MVSSSSFVEVPLTEGKKTLSTDGMITDISAPEFQLVADKDMSEDEMADLVTWNELVQKM